MKITSIPRFSNGTRTPSSYFHSNHVKNIVRISPKKTRTPLSVKAGFPTEDDIRTGITIATFALTYFGSNSVFARKAEKDQKKLEERFDKKDASSVEANKEINARIDHTNKEINARIDKCNANIVESNKEINARIDQTNKEINARIDQTNKEINARIDDVIKEAKEDRREIQRMINSCNERINQSNEKFNATLIAFYEKLEKPKKLTPWI